MGGAVLEGAVLEGAVLEGAVPLIWAASSSLLNPWLFATCSARLTSYTGRAAHLLVPGVPQRVCCCFGFI